MSATGKSFTVDDARVSGEEIGIDWPSVTDDDPHVTSNTATLRTWSPAERMLVATAEAEAATTPTRAGIA